MLHNATLIQLSSPPPATPGPDRSDRCALCPPTASDLRWLGQNALAATAVIYLPLPSPPPTFVVAVDDLLRVQLDGQAASTWRAVDVAELVGAAIGYMRIFVVPYSE